MDNYKFRFRKKDWSDFDERAMLKKLDELKDKDPLDMSPDEFSEALGMTREEIIEYLMHKVEGDGFLYKGVKLMTAFELMGFEQKELAFLSGRMKELLDILQCSYDGPGLDEGIEIYGEEAVEKSTKSHIFVPLLSSKNRDLPFQSAVEELLSFLIEAGLTDDQIQFVTVMPEVFADWIREHMDFPEM